MSSRTLHHMRYYTPVVPLHVNFKKFILPLPSRKITLWILAYYQVK